MAALAVPLQVASLFMGIAGMSRSSQGADQASQAALDNAARARAADEFEAQQLEQNAGQALAAGQRSAADVRRQALLVQSRALAVAAAGGGGASDPTVVNLMSRVAGEGSYRSSLAIYDTEDQARAMRLQATAKRYQGDLGILGGAAQAQAYQIQGDTAVLRGAGTTLSSGASLFSKYGGTGPDPAVAPASRPTGNGIDW